MKASASLDRETNPVLNVSISVDDPDVGTTPDDTNSLDISVGDVNESPSLTLENIVIALSETISTSNPIRVADIIIADDALGMNVLGLSGADSALFDIQDDVLVVKPGAILDFETNPVLDVTVSVDDSTVGNTPDDVASMVVNVTAEDDEIPQTENHSATLGEGATLVINASHLSATDVDSDDATLIFTVTSLPANGVLKKLAAVVAVDDTFTQQDITDGKISYQHDGGNTTNDSFTFTVKDEAGNETGVNAFSIVVTPIDDEVPVVGNHAANLDEGDTLVFDATHLAATDQDTDVALLEFTVKGLPGNGQLSKDGFALAVDAVFAQSDITAGKIGYKHDDSNTTSDAFTFTVKDPAGNETNVESFALTITPVDDDLPVITNSSLALSQGATATLTPSDLSADDSDSDNASLVFTLKSLPTNGVLQKDGSPLAVDSTFTQQDVADAKINYAHNDSLTISDSFSLTVKDHPAGNESAPSDFSVAVSHTGQVTNQRTGVSFATIAEGIIDAQSGDVLLIADGVYQENLIVDKAITLRAQNVGRAIIDGGDSTGAAVDVAANASFEGLWVRNAMFGFDANGDAVTYTCYRCIVSNTERAFSVRSPGPKVGRAIVTHSIVLDSGGAVGINDGKTIEISNSIFDNVGTAYVMHDGDGIIGRNNLMHNVTTRVNQGPIPGPVPPDPGEVIGDPMFVDRAGGDFRLASGSPAIDAGLDLGLPFNGTAPDIGAFESQPTDLVSKVRVRLTDSDYLQLTEVQVLELGTGNNLALAGTATQSSTYNSYAGPEQAIDGDTKSGYPTSVSLTKKEFGAWWEVDLGGSYDVEIIQVYNRNDAGTRLEDAVVEAFDANRNVVWSGTITETRNSSVHRFPLFDKIPPTADLADPINGGRVSPEAINTRRHIDVTFADTGGSGLDTTTIDGDEFTLSGAGVGTAVLTGTPTPVAGTASTYRYQFTGEFVVGPVDVNFVAATWQDHAGNANEAETESFTVENVAPGLVATVRVQLTDTDYLQLTEVQVLERGTEKNLAPAGTATQSSTYNSSSGPEKAIDNDTDSGYPVSVSLTKREADAWWEVDLGGSYDVGTIKVFNRNTDGTRLEGAVVEALDAEGKVVWTDTINGAVNRSMHTFEVVTGPDPTPPTADLADPPKDGRVSLASINTRRYIDVTFADTGGSGLDTTTIDGDEFTLSGAGVGTAVLSGAPTLVAGTASTYRYAFTGDFVEGVVDVNFVAGRWQDLTGNSNAAETESFTVEVPDGIVAKVRVRLTDTNYLQLTEVQVLRRGAGTNLALTGTATQSSTYSSSSGPEKAKDNNTNSDYPVSVSLTKREAGAWWEVDLGGSYDVGTIKVFNRKAEGARLEGAVVEALDANGVVVWSDTITAAGNGSMHRFDL